MPPVLARVGIDDDDPTIRVAVGDERLVCVGIDVDIGRLARYLVLLLPSVPMPNSPTASSNSPSGESFRKWALSVVSRVLMSYGRPPPKPTQTLS